MYLLSMDLKIKIFKTIIFPIVLHACKTWSFTLREECRLRVFENRIMRRIFESKMDENGEWRSFTMRNFIVCTGHIKYSG
jgi:hypothetical protein